jgi:hypothetical protein
VIDDETRYHDDEYVMRFYSITLFIVEPESRDAFFKFYCDPLPDGETERRRMLIEALKNTLRTSNCEGIISATGIPCRKLENRIHKA